MQQLDKNKAKKIEEKGKVWSQFPALCKSCGLCIEVCPRKCLSWDDSTLGHFNQPTIKCDIKNCIQCKICENACPDMAIRVKD
jgi:2-oxoglutarate ferredoxin oxidoreductase subunit delta